MEDNNQEIWWRPVLVMFARLSGWVAFPVIIGTLIGGWLDKKYGTEPWIMIAGVGISFIISIIGLIKETMKEYKKIGVERHPRVSGDPGKDN